MGYEIAEKALPSADEPLLVSSISDDKPAARPTSKRDRRGELNKDVTKIRINAGRKKNMRPGDILGALTNIEGVSSSDIGIIDVQDYYSYVDILANKGSLVMEALQDMPVKGKKVNVKQMD